MDERANKKIKGGVDERVCHHTTSYYYVERV